MKNRKTICILLALLLSSSISSATALTSGEEYNEIPNGYSNSSIENYSNENLESRKVDIDSWYDIMKIGFKWWDHFANGYYESPSTSVFHDQTGNFTYALQNNVKFNGYGNSGVDNLAYKQVKCTEGGQRIAIWAHPQSMFRKDLAIGVRVRGGDPVYSTVVSSAVIHTYSIPAYGIGTQYEGYYVSTEETAWNLGLRFDHYTADRYGVMPYSLNAKESNGVIYTPINNVMYRKPSESIIESYTLNSTIKGVMTFKELRNEFFYEEVGSYMDIAKTLKANDRISMVDEIQDIYYDSENNETRVGFKFEKDSDLEYISFKNDLTQDYKVGDQIELNFRVLPIEGTEYVVLDYNYIYDLEKQAPIIDEFIGANNEK